MHEHLGAQSECCMARSRQQHCQRTTPYTPYTLFIDHVVACAVPTSLFRTMDPASAVAESAGTRRIQGMVVLVGTDVLPGQTPSTQFSPALATLPQPAAPRPPGPAPAAPPAPVRKEATINLPEPEYDEWTHNAYSKHSTANVATANEFDSNTNDRVNSPYTMTFADLEQLINGNESTHSDRHIAPATNRHDGWSAGRGPICSRSRRLPAMQNQPQGRFRVHIDPYQTDDLPKNQLRSQDKRRMKPHVSDMVHHHKESSNDLVTYDASSKNHTIDGSTQMKST